MIAVGWGFAAALDSEDTPLLSPPEIIMVLSAVSTLTVTELLCCFQYSLFVRKPRLHFHVSGHGGPLFSCSLQHVGVKGESEVKGY